MTLRLPSYVTAASRFASIAPPVIGRLLPSVGPPVAVMLPPLVVIFGVASLFKAGAPGERGRRDLEEIEE